MLVILVLFSVFQLHSAQETCGPIGTNSETEFSARRDLRFYLNTANPAPCNGTITRWRYCYYGPSFLLSTSYRVTFAVYRRILDSGGDGDFYQRVSNTFTADRVAFINPISSGFNCHDELDIGSEAVEVQRGDVVGACVFDPENHLIIFVHSQLDVIGEADGYSLLEMNDVSECDFGEIPSRVSASDLRETTSRILHLYAEIDPVPTTPPITTIEDVETSASPTTVVTTQANTTPANTVPTTTQETTVDTPVPTTITVRESTTTNTGTTTMLEMTSETTTVASTTLPPEETTESTTVTVPSTSTTAEPQTDTTGIPTLAATTITMTQADTTHATTTMTTQPDTTDPTSTMMTSTIMMTQADTTTVSDSPTVLTTTDQPAAPDTTQEETVQQTTTPELLDGTTSQAVNPNTIGETGQQVSGGPNLGIIIGPVGAVVLLLISGAVIVIVVALFRKRQKSIGQYSTSGRGIQHVNGVDNMNYSTGFCNLTALEASSCTYEVLMDAAGVTSGKKVENDYDMAESTLSNTYEYVRGGPYSEVAVQYATTSIESEYHYSTHDTYGTSMYSLLERNKQEDIYGNLDAYYAPASIENEIYSQLQTCGVKSIPHSQIKITGHLGSGQFGNVEKGTWQSEEVALKTLKEGSKEQDKVKFLQEAAIMAQFKHPNVVILHGVVSDKEPLMLVVEFMHRGDLRNYLHSLRQDPGELPLAALPEILLSFSQQVALGMHYLSAKRFVHRDLAARNILVSNDNICKIADFGMSRDLADENYYVSHGGMIPVKWTAPEAIHYKKYSTASDIWSYGCLLYEIWSLGCKPFEGSPNIEVVRIIDSKHRLSPPPGCPRVIYELMIQCWNPVAGGRPAFRQIVISLSGTKDKLLSIPQEAISTHNLAGVLGSPLEAGKQMYADLQNQYLNNSNPDYDDYQLYT